MPTRLGRRFDPDFAGYPTHMAREDLEIWRRWYPTLPTKPIDLYFDVGLGEGRDAPPAAAAWERAYWRHITQKRADALLIYPDHVLLVELRDHATSSALGRLLMYRALLSRDNPFAIPIRAALVTNWPDPDIPALARANGIAYTVSL